MIKHIIFDFDGTIVDSSELALQIINGLAEKYHYKKVTMEEVNILKNVPVRERFKQIGLPLYKIPRMSLDVMTMYKDLVSSLKTFEGIQNLMLCLKHDGFCLSVISSNSVENITDFIKNNDLEVFDHIISARNLFGKHRSIKKYVKQFNLKSDEVLYVGDELRDIVACKKISVRIVAVIWGFDPISLLKSGNPDYIAYMPEDIISVVKSIQVNNL